jgi:hypothetical protein
MEAVVKLRFLYAPVSDLKGTLPFYRDDLGLSEAWREGEETVAFALPDSDVQIMVSVSVDAAGPMYQVDSVDAFLQQHADFPVCLPKREIPDGFVAGVNDPAGNVVYVFDQSTD